MIEAQQDFRRAELRASLIAEGVLVPADVVDARRELELDALPCVRLDGPGRAAAARAVKGKTDDARALGLIEGKRQ